MLNTFVPVAVNSNFPTGSLGSEVTIIHFLQVDENTAVNSVKAPFGDNIHTLLCLTQFERIGIIGGQYLSPRFKREVGVLKEDVVVSAHKAHNVRVIRAAIKFGRPEDGAR